MASYWRNEKDELIVDSKGRAIECDICPCSSYLTCEDLQGSTLTLAVYRLSYISDEAGSEYVGDPITLVLTYSECETSGGDNTPLHLSYFDDTWTLTNVTISLSRNGSFLSGSALTEEGFSVLVTDTLPDPSTLDALTTPKVALFKKITYA